MFAKKTVTIVKGSVLPNSVRWNFFCKLLLVFHVAKGVLKIKCTYKVNAKMWIDTILHQRCSHRSTAQSWPALEESVCYRA